MTHKFFSYRHLPLTLHPLARALSDVADLMENALPASAEKSAGMRKLLEAKDCFIRAKLEALEGAALPPIVPPPVVADVDRRRARGQSISDRAEEGLKHGFWVADATHEDSIAKVTQAKIDASPHAGITAPSDYGTTTTVDLSGLPHDGDEFRGWLKPKAAAVTAFDYDRPALAGYQDPPVERDTLSTELHPDGRVTGSLEVRVDSAGGTPD